MYCPHYGMESPFPNCSARYYCNESAVTATPTDGITGKLFTNVTCLFYDTTQHVNYPFKLIKTINVSIKGLFTFTDPDSGSDIHSNPIPVLDIWDWNLNLALCSMQSSA